MAIPRKSILKKIAGLRETIDHHLDHHIPECISTADRGLVWYWHKEVGGRISEMEDWAKRLPKNQAILMQAAEYRDRLLRLLMERLSEIRERSL